MGHERGGGGGRRIIAGCRTPWCSTLSPPPEPTLFPTFPEPPGCCRLHLPEHQDGTRADVGLHFNNGLMNRPRDGPARVLHSPGESEEGEGGGGARGGVCVVREAGMAGGCVWAV